jgi:hypothetical protein
MVNDTEMMTTSKSALFILDLSLSYIAYRAIINVKFTAEIKGLSIIAATRISLISYIRYTSSGDTLLCCRIELIDATN